MFFVCLKHMLDASRAAINHLASSKREDLNTNRTILSPIVRELEIIGEAANSIPNSMEADDCHDFDVDHDIVWITAKDYLIPTNPKLENLLHFFLNRLLNYTARLAPAVLDAG